MRRLASSTFFIALLVVQPRAESLDAQNVITPPSEPAKADSHRSGPNTVRNFSDVMCQTLEAAARANDLPLEFFAGLIWQESRFDPHAVSRAGAQGVAQFMPTTAALRGLQNPFDPIQAISKSAELLRDLKSQFGNLGLAAAAYNAGPKRVQDWMAGRRGLPLETQAYIRIVTGRSAEEWRVARPGISIAALPASIPCLGLAKPVAARPEPALATTEKPRFLWGIQLIGSASETTALAAYQQLVKAHTAILGAHEPLVIQTPLGKNGSWYRVRVGADSRESAENLCAGLRRAGISCLVQRN